MPTELRGFLGKYRVHFWSNKGDDPIHVHVTKHIPSAQDARFWLYDDGTVGHDPKSGTKTIDKGDEQELSKQLTKKHAYLHSRFLRLHPNAMLKSKL